MDKRHIFEDEDENFIGNKLEDFEILQYLGGNHSVYLAKVKSKIDHQIYAMKIITDIKENKYKDIENKINMIKLLDHQNIMKYFSSFVENNNYHLLMEYAENGNLKSYFKIHKILKRKIPEEKLIDIYYQAMSGIKYLHDEKFLHCNVNPSTIFMTKEGNIKIGGFEYLVRLNNKNDRALVSRGDILYSSPILLNDEECGEEVDIYSLKCIFNELLNLKARNIVVRINQKQYKIVSIDNSENDNMSNINKYIMQNQKYILEKYNNQLNQNSNIKCAYLSIFNILQRYVFNHFDYRLIKNNDFNKTITNSFFMYGPLDKISDFNAEYLRNMLIKNNKSFSKLGEIPLFELIKYLLMQLHIENNEYNNNYTKIFAGKGNENRIKRYESFLSYNSIFREHFKSFISSEIGFYGIYEINSRCQVHKNEINYYFESFYYIVIDLDNTDYTIKNIFDACKSSDNNIDNKDCNVDTIKTLQFCFNCNKMTEHIETKSIYKYPHNLIIFIKNNKNKKLILDEYLNSTKEHKLVSTIYLDDKSKKYEYNYLNDISGNNWFNQNHEPCSRDQGQKVVLFYTKYE